MAENNNDTQEVNEPEIMVYQAESGRLTGTKVATALHGYSGSGYVTGLDEDGNAIDIDFIIEVNGYYTIVIRHASLEGRKLNRLFIDGDIYGEIISNQTTGFVDWSMGTIFLTAGVHTLTIGKFWGRIDVDCIKVFSADKPTLHQPAFDLVNQAASKEARDLMGYFKNIYGQRIITGQHTSAASGPEIEDLKLLTHKLPALRGFDLLSYSHNTELADMSDSCVSEIANNRGSVDAAIEWYNEKNGIVAICWHWFSPVGGRDKAFYTEFTDFDLELALRPGTDENQALLADLDAIAKQLIKLRDAGVPVLWRPLHEAEGRWFWWGAKGPEPFKKLWRLMFDKYTQEYQLNNLIWIWSAPHPDWYPGNDCVDIIGMDIYVPSGNYGPLKCSFDYAVSLSNGSKPVALSENGAIPDPQKLLASGAGWLWYMPWWGGGATYGNANTEEHVVDVYQHPYVVTLDQLPKLG